MKRTVSLAFVSCFVLTSLAATLNAGEIDKEILGGWQLKMTTPDGEARKPIVLIGRQYDRYAAWYVGENGLEQMKSVKLQGDTLSGSITPKEQPDVTVKLEARPTTEETCEGIAKYESTDGDAGSWKFSGKKIDLSSMDEVLTWKLKFTTPDDEDHVATLLVLFQGEDVSAWYTGKNHDLPAREMKIEGDQVTMKISAETEDKTRIDLVFRATATEQSASGTAEYKVEGESGSFSFTATRVD